MLNHGVLQHRCAPVPIPATKRSTSALGPTIAYIKFIKKFRLTLSHEGTTHRDLSKLRARHTKHHMNERNAKKAPENGPEQATRRAAQDDLGVWRKVHRHAENYSTVPTV